MSKKKSMKKSSIAILVIVIIIVVVAYQKYGGVDQVADVADEADDSVSEAAPVAQAESAPVEETQPLYPDLCYAAGGTPTKASDGCDADEENIGDVPGFKVPYVCCS